MGQQGRDTWDLLLNAKRDQVVPVPPFHVPSCGVRHAQLSLSGDRRVSGTLPSDHVPSSRQVSVPS